MVFALKLQVWLDIQKSAMLGATETAHSYECLLFFQRSWAWLSASTLRCSQSPTISIPGLASFSRNPQTPAYMWHTHMRAHTHIQSNKNKTFTKAVNVIYHSNMLKKEKLCYPFTKKIFEKKSPVFPWLNGPNNLRIKENA